LFCDGSARQIVAMLLDECAAAGVELRLNQRIRDVSRTDTFLIHTEKGDIAASSVVLATGGLSIPKMGATGLSHDIARRFGLSLTDIRPGLVPLTLPPALLARTQSLSGLSLQVVASVGRYKFREAMLFTHRGLSGPAILQISSVWREGDTLTIDLLPDLEPGFLVARKRARPKTGVRALLHEVMPQRAADLFVPADLVAKPIADVPDKALLALGASLKAWQVIPSGTEGYAKAEVTLGGIDTNALSSRTMEAKSIPGLFVIGEALDVTGWLGGYNFQWAWASGYSAGLVA
jgi:predicted Rossmann fold flavoprotein